MARQRGWDESLLNALNRDLSRRQFLNVHWVKDCAGKKIGAQVLPGIAWAPDENFIGTSELLTYSPHSAYLYVAPRPQA